ncbi:inorganic diphosphatase [Anaeromyxobacter oryzae]|uniref:inorganic diphosphatase n=1 Tax=Anaeromyxobacter oryzae TaxID=2918170 RepID=A0ABM7WPU2_9BACT|nr:inorganic diphosphatase [Anaeromyxobacter oryzae]BDG01475.1 inorganic pyrophosphatase [Anaeromyxobacter oryzae]
MHRTALRRLITAAAFLALAPAAVSASDWKDRLDLQLAPGYQLVQGDYAAGVPDTLVFLANQELNVYTDFSARNADGTINAVIEIPQGDVRKFETDVTTGRLFWELKKGQPRTVAYLGYPGNYGMIPRTLGGDGDPLDVVVIGGTELRGAVAAVKVVAVMRMVDGGEPDDKLIAVLPGSPFDGMSLDDLRNAGVTTILKTWFESYKGPGEIQVPAFEDLAAANQVLDEAMTTYAASAVTAPSRHGDR